METAPQPLLERRRLRVDGLVQGVGFRPFVHALAGRLGLAGFVLNDGRGVVIEAEGEAGALDTFAGALADEAPALASVASVTATVVPVRGERAFAIAASAEAGGTARVPADAATCDDCLRELFDPLDRRYRYPFLNCTQCGPRFTSRSPVRRADLASPCPSRTRSPSCSRAGSWG